MNTAIHIADAVVAVINAAPLDPAIVATRKVVPEYEMRKLEETTVIVVPRSIETTRVTRASDKHRYAMDIAVMRKAPEGDIDAFVDQMCDIVVAVRGAVAGQHLTIGQGGTATTALFISAGIDPVYSLDHLTQQRTFLSVIRCEYDTMDGTDETTV